ncbi:hypothetical protein fh0823_14260 [Francisella halioticida]|uniref:Uncharacterized protein n=1 Tax=Francisella halioticida TaxID=549298 RepID=A0ABN5AXI0_9GAMM|nr:hypothetical protein CDV26_08435 [Francisella halioticida]BCD91287.1 hypothetical protein fh0823_14260 [Francisella halioticida]
MIQKILDKSIPTILQRGNNCFIKDIHGYDFVYQGTNSKYCVLFSIMYALHNFSSKHFSIMKMMEIAANIVESNINIMSSEPFRVIEQYGVYPRLIRDVIASLNLSCIYFAEKDIFNIQKPKDIKENLQDMIYPVNLGQFTTSFSIIYSN